MKNVSQVFTTGAKEITTEPSFYDNVVEFNGTYYKAGGKRLEVRDLKVENDNFYFLTLAAVAKELNRREMRNANIPLSIGGFLQDLEQRSTSTTTYQRRRKLPLDSIMDSIVSNLQGCRYSLSAMQQ